MSTSRIQLADRTFFVVDSALKETLRLATKAAAAPLPVLICGPTGTGKELIARYIHERSPRSAGPFVSVNCAAIPEGLIESELFGHEKGAFTGAVARRLGKFEIASGGTILLDEISDMPVYLQAKLLRVLQENEIDRVGGHKPVKVQVRIIATMNRAPGDLLRQGLFRLDLFHRLNGIRIDCDPLFCRREAIVKLAQEFVLEASREYCQAPAVLSPEALEKLVRHRWPGNVRELKATIERAIALSDSTTLSENDIAFDEVSATESTVSSPQLPGEGLAGVEKNLILQTLEKTQGNQKRAAQMLGITDRTLRNKLRIYREG